ncbi:asparagine synthase (glutamine-hydrolyzing) [Methylohalomonas lacus]|nr:asparagine synthase (glutamine-hydrolyzing) [Methylohalomonas lacus]
MCGLTGFFSRKIQPESTVMDELQRMSSTLRHRGPDYEGAWSDPQRGIALAHRRLAIQDLSPLGHQPMFSRCGRFVIVFNGEIYNFLDLKMELQAKGETFQGHSDTEVMLAAFTHWGVPDSLERFDGMFSFALWDRHTQKLYLARDRIGEKPLYYGWQGNTFLFGSELKALRRHRAWRNEINRDALTLLLRHNYIPAPHSIFTDIHKLSPGTFLILDAGSAHIEIRTYWSYRKVCEDGIADPLTGSPEEMAEALESRLRATIKRQMIADVPVGAFLSGGIDSSTVVALMQSIHASPVKTFTIGFSEGDYNEASQAKAVSEHLKTDHTELYVSPEQALEVVPQLPQIYDEPFADSSQIPTYLLAKLAGEKVTVALSGDGGDELFCGYSRYFSLQRHMETMQRYPRPLHRAGARLLKRIPKSLLDPVAGSALRLFTQRSHHHAGERLRDRADDWLHASLREAYQRKISYWREAGIVHGGREPDYVLNDTAPALVNGSILQNLQYLDMLSYLPDDILAKVDRAAMANSLETRIPLLSREIIELAARIPDRVNTLHADGKWPLRRILSKYVPEELTERPKQGFAVPVREWLRGPLQRWADDLLDPARLKHEGYFDADQVQEKWRRHTRRTEDASFKLWGILMFETWLESWQQN